MTQTKQPYKFDPNTFVISVMKRAVFASAVQNNINVLTDTKWRNVSDDGVYVAGYNGPENDEELQRRIASYPDEAPRIEAMYELFKNPNSPNSMDILNFWKVVGPVLNEERPFYKQDFLVLLNRIDFLGLTPEVQLELLKDVCKYKLRGMNYSATTIKPEEYKEIVHAVYMKILSNPKVPLEDKANAAAKLQNIDVTRDVIADAKKELDEEMNKTTDFDRDTVEEISKYAIEATSGLSSEYEEYKKEVEDFFKLDNIFKIGSKYVAKTEESDREKRVKMENELKTAKYTYSNTVADKDSEINRLKQELQFAKEEEEKAKTKNQKLTQQLNELESILREMQAMMKTIKMKAAAITAEGMFGRGKKAEELNDYVQEALKSKIKVMIKD